MAVTPRFSMHAAPAAICSLLVLLATAIGTATSSSAHARQTNGGCIATERAALLAFKAGITSDPAKRLDSWRGHDCCRWSGIRCGKRTGHVINLNLSNTLPLYDDPFYLLVTDDSRTLDGQISSSLLVLQHLKYLDLSGNFPGVRIPEFLGSLKSMVHLNLAGMQFQGRIPPQLGNLSSLLYFNIRSVYYDMSPPISDISWLPYLSSLEHLDMSGVNLSTIVDWTPVVNMLPNLRVLRLSDCDIVSWTPSLLHPNLTSLEILDLSENSLQSRFAPNWFWNVTSLKKLNLANCGLFSPLPDELGNMTSLESLHLSYNGYISGMIPSTLKNLCNLKSLDLSGTNTGWDVTRFMERLPSCAWNNLQELNLAAANMTGNLPNWLGDITSLQHLLLHDNQLSGGVPRGIGSLSNLTILLLDRNNFSGAMTEDHFAGLVSLKKIGLSDNSLEFVVDSNWVPPFKLELANFSSCQMGPRFPTWFRWQNQIFELGISKTGLVSRIPHWFWTVFSNATYLDLSHNQLSGELPLHMEFMSMEIFRLQSNRLTGSIPASICGWQELIVFELSNNLLVGGLPSCDREQMVHWNSNSSSLAIRTLRLSNNSLSGNFPLFLQNCEDLTVLDLGNNKFSGDLPSWIGEKLSSLVILRLRSNFFSGHIPIQMTKLDNLRYMDIANNSMSGSIPHHLANLEGMTDQSDSTDTIFDTVGIEFDVALIGFLGFTDYIGGFDDSISVVIKGQELEYGTGLKFVVNIDLSCNNLIGLIPEKIFSLDGLINLNLSGNHLSGSIPYKVGSLKSLESLDLSNNQLSGRIPSTLSDLTSLIYLNLSYNNLSGRIPSGNQLDTLKTDDPASMYIGNAGLCGHPLLKHCPGDEPSPSDPITGYEDGSTKMYFYLSLVVGLIVGHWLVFSAFLFMKTWKIAFFHLFDKQFERICTAIVVTLAILFRKTSAH